MTERSVVLIAIGVLLWIVAMFLYAWGIAA